MYNSLFPAFPGRPRCPTEKPWVPPTGGLAGVETLEGTGKQGHRLSWERQIWPVLYREAGLFTCSLHTL
ncbi:UNVERIFIED_CONTAM: hypothetical protein FKN15_016562 [Acipenser sinensis]